MHSLAGLSVLFVVLTTTIFVRCQEDTEYIAENVFQVCNQTIREPSGHGVIMSPNFTTSYPNNLHCWWTIVVESDRIVTLTFGHFDIESGVNCQYDKVSVFNGPSAEHPVLGRFCGPFRPGQQVSTSNKMHIRMDTDSSNAKRGFFAIFEANTPALATEDSCGGLLNSDEGSFHSPNYPNSEYPPSVSCSWHIRTGEDRIIRMNFKEFDIEHSDRCKYDAMVVYAGWSISEKTKYIDRYCGDTTPTEIVSPGNELFVTFISDASGFGRGFVATYTTERTAEEREEITEIDIVESLPRIPESTTTLPPSTTPTPCPTKCSKTKLKAAVCDSNYIAVVQISESRPLLTGGSGSVQVVKAFKLGALPTSSAIDLRITCSRCFKISKAGNYLVIGRTTTPSGMIVSPGDVVVRYRDRKHTKLMAKLQKRCGDNKRPRKGKRRAARKKKRESDFRKQ